MEGRGSAPIGPVPYELVSVQTWFTNEEVVADPGSTVTLALSIHNLGDETDVYTIVPAGLAASWVRVSRGNVTLFGGSQDTVDVLVTAPPLPTTSAGPTVVGVRIISQNDPDEASVAEIVLDVQPFDDRRIVALQPVQRSRRRATYEFMVENHGNGLANCRLKLIDASGRIDGSFDPPAVGVTAGGASLVRLRAKAKRELFRRSIRTLDFEVEAEEQSHDPAAGAMSLVQPPTIPGSLVGRVLATAAIVGAAVFAWFGVVRPEIQNTAEDQVDARIEELVPEEQTEPLTPTVTVAEPVETGTVDAAAAPVDEGEPKFYRLEVGAAVTLTSDESETIPDDEVFDLTDIRVENPFNESGLARLRINGDPVFQWSLSNIRGQLFEPRLTPIRLQPGDNITFSVRCDAIGTESTSTTCTTAINLGGRMLEADDL